MYVFNNLAEKVFFEAAENVASYSRPAHIISIESSIRILITLSMFVQV